MAMDAAGAVPMIVPAFVVDGRGLKALFKEALRILPDRDARPCKVRMAKRRAGGRANCDLAPKFAA